MRQAIVVVWITLAVGMGDMSGEARRATAGSSAAGPTVTTGRLQIRKAAYQASFGRTEGFSFSPAIGGAYSQRLTWRYRLDGLGAGRTRTMLGPVDPQIGPQGAHVVEFRRPGLVERYVADDRGVEQIFVLERSPGAGDVRIDGEIRAHDVAVRKDGGLAFSDREGWSVHYSRPIAYDARKRSVAVRAELTGTRLSLVLDGPSLADAVYPITIDPHIVAGPTLSYTDSDAQDTDVAYNARLGEFLVVFSAAKLQKPGGRQIRVQRFDAVGNAIGVSQVIVDNDMNVAPRVAYHLHTNQYLVVWQQTLLSVPNAQPVARALRLDTMAQVLGTAFTLNDSKGSRAYRPDVAARNFTVQQPRAETESAWLVTWRTTTGQLWSVGVMQERIHAGGAEMGETPLSVNNTQVIGAVDEQAVAHDPLIDRYVVVWHEEGTLRGRTVGAAQGDLADEFGVELPFGGDSPRQPAIACDAGIPRCMVAYIIDSFLGDDLLAGTYMHSGAVPVQHYAEPIPEMLDRACARPAVAPEGGGFALAYQRLDPGIPGTIPTSGWDVHGVALLTLSDYVHFPLTNDGSLQGIGADQRPSIALGAYGFTLNAWQRQTTSTARAVGTALGFSTYAARFVHGRGGDYDGDGRSDLFLFEPEQQQWRIRTASAALFTVPMGLPGDIPVLMDVDADGLSDLGTWRPSTGVFQVLRRATNTWVSATLGIGADIPVPGDYVGSAADDFAVFRPWTGTWSVIDGEAGTLHTGQLGVIGDIPVPADFDRNGKVDLAVWRSGSGWYSVNIDGSGAIAHLGFATADATPLAADLTGDGWVDRVLVMPGLFEWEIRDGVTGQSRLRSFYNWQAGSIPMLLDWWHDERPEIAIYNSRDQEWRICDPQIHNQFSICGGANLDVVAFGSAKALPASRP
jgi:hypothetical protein